MKVGSEKWEVGSGKWEVGSGKWEVRSGKWEVGSGKWEVRSNNYKTPISYAVTGKWEVRSEKALYGFRRYDSQLHIISLKSGFLQFCVKQTTTYVKEL